MLDSDDANSSSNYNESAHNVKVGLVPSEIYALVRGGARDGSCTVLTNPDDDIVVNSRGQFVQTITLKNCTGDGILTLYVNSNTTIDLAGNVNEQSNSDTKIIDNTNPLIEISNPTVIDHEDNKYANKDKEIQFTLTISDLNLFDSAEFAGTTNYDSNALRILNTEMFANILNSSGTTIGTCAITLENPIILVAQWDPNIIDSFTQLVKLTNCTGIGKLSVGINEGSTLDLADNKNILTQTSKNTTNVDTVIIDNTIPVISGSASLVVFVGDPVKSVEEITAYYGLTGTDNSDTNGCYSGFWDTSRSATSHCDEKSET